MTLQSNLVWQKALMPENATIQEVIKNLDESALQIALIVSEKGILCGTVTDGDIRRGLLRGLDMQCRVDEIMFKNPLVVPPSMGCDMVLPLMTANKIRQLPIIDAERRVIGLHLWDEIISPYERPNTMIIMAGGQGKRLRPYTEDCPKPMLPVGGKPMLEHIIERAKMDGFSHFVLAVHYHANKIEEYFGDGEKWKITIDYLREEAPLGTAGALSLLDPRPDLPFVVTNGDVLTDVHYSEILDFHLHHQSFATMAIRSYEWQHPFGVVHTEGINVAGFEEKPIHRTHVNAGIYVLDPEVLNILNKSEKCDMPTLFEKIIESGKNAIVYPMHEPWLDVGRPDDLEQARKNKSLVD